MTCVTMTTCCSSVAAQTVQLQKCAHEAYLPYDLVVLHGAAFRAIGWVYLLCNHATFTAFCKLYTGASPDAEQSTGLDLKRQQGPAALGFHTVFCSIDFATGKH